MKSKKRKLAEKLVGLLNSKERHLNQMEAKAKEYSTIPLLQKILMKVTKDNIDAILSIYVNTYEKSCSEKLLKALIKFYKSKVGREFLEVGPPMNKILNQAADYWAAEVLVIVADEYEKEMLNKKAEDGVNLSQFVPPLDMKKLH